MDPRILETSPTTGKFISQPYYLSVAPPTNPKLSRTFLTTLDTLNKFNHQSSINPGNLHT